jgi:hypothetical protein
MTSAPAFRAATISVSRFRRTTARLVRFSRLSSFKKSWPPSSMTTVPGRAASSSGSFLSAAVEVMPGCPKLTTGTETSSASSSGYPPCLVYEVRLSPMQTTDLPTSAWATCEICVARYESTAKATHPAHRRTIANFAQRRDGRLLTAELIRTTPASAISAHSAGGQSTRFTRIKVPQTARSHAADRP